MGGVNKQAFNELWCKWLGHEKAKVTPEGRLVTRPWLYIHAPDAKDFHKRVKIGYICFRCGEPLREGRDD